MIRNFESRRYSMAGFLNRSCKTMLSLAAVLALAGSVHGAAVADFGTTAPTPGINDIAQTNAGTADDTGGNYFSDKASPPGQAFTTGSNPSGYGLTTLYIKTGGYNADRIGRASCRERV